MIPIKTRQEIDLMHEAGGILAKIMDELEARVKPGVATIDFDRAAVAAMKKFRVRPAFKDFHGYPAHICVSVNEEVVHGIPGPRRLKDGDIVSIDIGIEREGFFADMAKTFPVGKIDDEKRTLIDATRVALEEAIRMLVPKKRLSEAAGAVQRYVEARGFSVVRNFVGHGIGRQLHEEPQVPNFVLEQDTGPVLEEGMVLAVEPMINAGTWDVEVLKDGWTAVTKDRRPSAHFEHTVAVRDAGPLVLTQ